MRSKIGRVVVHLEERISTMRYRIKNHFGRLDALKVLPYLGYGTRDRLYIKGRVLEQRGVTLHTDEHTTWENFVDMVRRFTSNHIPRARVKVRYHDTECEAVTNKDGFFELYLEPPTPPAADQLWHEAEIKLIEPLAKGQDEACAVARVLVPPDDAEFGVISDIDDTIIHTSATDTFKMLRIVFLNNARTRIPFPGIGPFYQTLQKGPTGKQQNPLFYLSSSSWHVYDLFQEFLDIHQIPTGPLLLREFSFDAEKILHMAHESYKLDRIRPLFEMYPNLPFILIGDSGQDDPEVYRQVAQQRPQQIRAIYIRDVASPRRHREVQAIADELRQINVPMELVCDTIAAAEHAAAHGWIQADAINAIQSQKARDETQIRPGEQLRDRQTN